MHHPDVTLLLKEASKGDRKAMDELFSATYDEFKLLAHKHRARWNGNPTMGTTVLVHEAYQKLVGQNSISLKDRAHFLSVAAKAMRHILVNYAKQQSARKRGGDAILVPLEQVDPAAPEVADEILVMNEALDRLGTLEPRRGRVVECRFFGGMSIEETARALDVSPATVKRDWTLAITWLRREMRLADTPA